MSTVYDPNRAPRSRVVNTTGSSHYLSASKTSHLQESLEKKSKLDRLSGKGLSFDGFRQTQTHPRPKLATAQSVAALYDTLLGPNGSRSSSPSYIQKPKQAHTSPMRSISSLITGSLRDVLYSASVECSNSQSQYSRIPESTSVKQSALLAELVAQLHQAVEDHRTQFRGVAASDIFIPITNMQSEVICQARDQVTALCVAWHKAQVTTVDKIDELLHAQAAQRKHNEHLRRMCAEKDTVLRNLAQAMYEGKEEGDTNILLEAAALAVASLPTRTHVANVPSSIPLHVPAPVTAYVQTLTAPTPNIVLRSTNGNGNSSSKDGEGISSDIGRESSKEYSQPPTTFPTLMMLAQKASPSSRREYEHENEYHPEHGSTEDRYGGPTVDRYRGREKIEGRSDRHSSMEIGENSGISCKVSPSRSDMLTPIPIDVPSSSTEQLVPKMKPFSPNKSLNPNSTRDREVDTVNAGITEQLLTSFPPQTQTVVREQEQEQEQNYTRTSPHSPWPTSSTASSSRGGGGMALQCERLQKLRESKAKLRQELANL